MRDCGVLVLIGAAETFAVLEIVPKLPFLQAGSMSVAPTYSNWIVDKKWWCSSRKLFL